MKKNYIFLICILLNTQIFSALKTSIVNGNWNVAGTWNPAGVPANTDDVIINTNVSITANCRIKNITINVNKNLTNTGFTFRIDGNFTNNGTYTDNSGITSFRGVVNQTITNKTSFFDLVINNAGNSILTTDTIWVKNNLNLTAGTLNLTNGILVIQNDAINNGIVSNCTSGNITGNFIFQKYITRCDGFSTYGSPFTNPITDFDWYYCYQCFSGYIWSNIYYYDETVTGFYDNGWFDNIGGNIQRGKGFSYWFENYVGGQNFPRTISLKGSLNFATTFNFGVTYTNNSVVTDIGWNLIANPFPGTIDWSSASGWTKTRVANAVYTWNTCSNVYASYVGGVGTNGGSRYISPMQGFFIKTTGASPALTATRAIIKPNISTLLKPLTNTTDTVNYVLHIGLGSDEIAIRLDSLSTDTLDSDYDAVAFLSDSSRLYSFIYGDTTNIYSINAIIPNINKVVPIKTRGSGTLNFSNVSSFKWNYNIYLKNLKTGVMDSVYENLQYGFANTSTVTFDTTFEIHFIYTGTTVGINNILINDIFKIYPNPTNSIITIQNNLKDNVEFELFNTIGEKVMAGTLKNQYNVIDISHLNAGIYFIRANSYFYKLIKE